MPQRPAIIVCERTGDWAEAVRLAFRRRSALDGAALAPPEVLETRSPAQLRSRLLERRNQGRPPSIPLLVVDENAPVQSLEFLAWHRDRGDDAPAVAALPDSEKNSISSDPGLLLREAGANVVVVGLREVRAVVGLYERFLQDLPRRLVFAENERSPDASWRDRLPWSSK